MASGEHLLLNVQFRLDRIGKPAQQIRPGHLEIYFRDSTQLPALRISDERTNKAEINVLLKDLKTIPQILPPGESMSISINDGNLFLKFKSNEDLKKFCGYVFELTKKQSSVTVTSATRHQGVDMTSTPRLANDSFGRSHVPVDRFAENESLSDFDRSDNALTRQAQSSLVSLNGGTSGSVRERTSPLNSVSTSYATPVSRFIDQSNLGGFNMSIAASVAHDLSQSVDTAFRSLTQSHETVVRGMVEQNRVHESLVQQIVEQNRLQEALVQQIVEQTRAFTNTCDGLVSQMKDLVLTNKVLVEEIKTVKCSSGAASGAGIVDNADTLKTRVTDIKKDVTTTPAAHVTQPLGVSPLGKATTATTATSTTPASIAPPRFGFPPAGNVKDNVPAFTSSIFGSSSTAPGLNFSSPSSKPVTSVQPFGTFQGFGTTSQTPTSQGFGGPDNKQLDKGTPPSTLNRTRQESEAEDGGGAETPFEPTVDFKPVIPLPALVDIKTGEENEEVLFRERAKLYRYDTDSQAFKERGLGELKILKDQQTGRARILMRREQVLKLCANHAIQPGMQLRPLQKSDRAYTWHCHDYSDGEFQEQTFAVRFKEVDQARKFKEIFDQYSSSAAAGTVNVSNAGNDKTTAADTKNEVATIKPSKLSISNTGTTSAVTASTANVIPSFGISPSDKTTAAMTAASTVANMPPRFGFPATDSTNGSVPALTSSKIFGSTSSTPGLSFASLATQNAMTTTTQPFGGFSGFGTIPQSPLFKGFGTSETKQPDKGTPPSSSRTRQDSDADDGGGAETPFEPTVEFKPVIPLPALVDIKTGEENEAVLFRERAKLYRYDKDSQAFKERGLGELKILKDQQTGRARILMRREQVLKLCANHAIQPGMQLLPLQKSERAYTWHCHDYSDGEFQEQTFAVRFKDVDQARNFKAIFDQYSSSAVVGTVSASNAGNEKATAADTKKEVSSNASSKSPSNTVLTTTTAITSTPAVAPQFGIPSSDKATWGSSKITPITTAAASVAPRFGFPTTTSTNGSAPPITSSKVFGSISSIPGFSFASLAAQNAVTPTTTQPVGGFSGFGTTSQSPIFKGFGIPETKQSDKGAPPSTLFRTRQDSETEDGAGAETPFEPTVDFKPVVPLPALVDIKTGEENEEVLFRERAKLFRYDADSKGFKERGLGELKILKHRQTGRARILMRREQVLKLCANHAIQPGMKLSPMQKSDRAYTWHCHDYSDGEFQEQTFAVRFKDVNKAKEFQKIFDQCSSYGGNETLDVSSVSDSLISSETEKEFEIMFEVKPDEKQEELAKKYSLPKTFYVEHKPCPGCIGCDTEEAQDRVLRQIGPKED